MTADTPATSTDNDVGYHILGMLDSHTFPSGVSVSYRTLLPPGVVISRQPVA